MVMVVPLLFLLMQVLTLGLTQFYMIKTQRYARALDQRRVLNDTIRQLYAPFLDQLHMASTCDASFEWGMTVLLLGDRRVWVYRCMDPVNRQSVIHYGSDF
jgi:hypothetical protein